MVAQSPAWLAQFTDQVQRAQSVPENMRAELLRQAGRQDAAWAAMQLLCIRRAERLSILPDPQSLPLVRAANETGHQRRPGARSCPVRALFRNGTIDLADLKALHGLELSYRAFFAGSSYRQSRWAEYVDEGRKDPALSAGESAAEEVFRRWLAAMLDQNRAQKALELALLEGLSWRAIDQQLGCRNGLAQGYFLAALEVYQQVRRDFNRQMRRFAHARKK